MIAFGRLASRYPDASPPRASGKSSTGWKGIACFTDQANQQRLRGEFEFAAGLFDEIMIDDFWFTDCTCPECNAARGDQ